MSKVIMIQRSSKQRAGRRLEAGHKPHQKGRRTKLIGALTRSITGK